MNDAILLGLLLEQKLDADLLELLKEIVHRILAIEKVIEKNVWDEIAAKVKKC